MIFSCLSLLRFMYLLRFTGGPIPGYPELRMARVTGVRPNRRNTPVRIAIFREISQKSKDSRIPVPLRSNAR